MKQKLLNILSNISVYLLVGIIVLGFIVVYAGFKADNTLFILIGLAVLFPFGIWFIIMKIKESKINKEEQNRIQNLIKNGNKVKVDLEKLDIKSNSYKQEVVKGSGTRSRNIQVDINHNVIILKIPYENTFIHYRIDISMETTKLKMHFAIKKETFIYVDKANKNSHYLDLSFLD